MGVPTHDTEHRGAALEHDSPGFEEAATHDDTSSNDSRQRMRRIQEYRAAAYRDPNAKLAALGGVNADLFEAEAHYAKVLQREFANGSGTIEEIENHRPAVELMIRLSKQIAQISQVELSISKPAARPLRRPR